MTAISDFENMWSQDGVIKDDAPGWAKYRKVMISEFPSPFRSKGSDPLARAVASAITKIDDLKQDADGPAFLGTNSALAYHYPEVKNVHLSKKMSSVDNVVSEVVKLFEGAPNWGSPLTMCNVIPQPNTAAIIASMLSQVFSPNILEGEYAWNVHKAELETAGMMANQIGWNPLSAGAIYTYGGGGCWLYGCKYGLTRVIPNSRKTGQRTEAKVICSQQSHFARLNSTDWTGIGTDSLVFVRTDPETNQMDVKHLESILQDLHKKNIPVALVTCTMGTTDASAFDPIAKVRELIDQYPNPAGFGKAVLYADSVVGWSWIMFKHYDFAKNPLGFSSDVLPCIRNNMEALKDIIHADAVGIDFHKVGWAPYASSAFLYKNADEFEGLLQWKPDAYLQVRTPYNPMYHTLEVSRSSSGSLAGWATLKYFGEEGFQAILGGILETKYFLYNKINALNELVVVNPHDTGLITLYRVYPAGMDAKAQFARELNDPAARAELIKHNDLIQKIGDKLFEWFRQGKKINGTPCTYTSFSTGFRNTTYNADGTDEEAVIYALKAFPMNVFVTPQIMDHLLDCVRAAREEVLSVM